MKVFNITDASTAALRNQGLENQHIRVGETVIPPGGSADIRGTARERSELSALLKVGALALDELPPHYAAKRGLTVYGQKLVPDEKPQVELPPMPISLSGPSFTRLISEGAPEEEPEAPKKRGK